MADRTQTCDAEIMQHVRKIASDALKSIVIVLETSSVPERDELLSDARAILVELDRWEEEDQCTP